MTFDDHVKCLFGDDDLDAYRDNMFIRSFNYQIKIISSHKLTFNNYDAKRITLEDKIHILPYGHYNYVFNLLIF